MSLVEILPTIRALPRADKLRLVYLLVAELAREEGIALVEERGPYQVWTPYNAFDAAGTLWQALYKDRTTP